MEMIRILRPGDALLYWGGGVYSWVIATKTWHKVDHMETYVGGGKSIGSRWREGVGTFPTRREGLIGIYRPLWGFDLEAVLRWQTTVEGMRYDWDSLIAFTGIRAKPDDGMFCSEHGAMAAMVSGGNPFRGEPPGLVAPFQFGITPAYEAIYAAGDQK